MKVKTILAVVMLLGIVAIAGAMPDQPNMKAARENLITARNALQRATQNKRAHKHGSTAINIANRAIAEVDAGIDFDRRHNHACSLTTETLLAGSPDQPHMQTALAALNSALNNLKQAVADKGGHRAKAIDLVNRAISEVNLGIQAGEGG